MRNKNFILIIIGQIISLFGNAILRFALPLYLLGQTSSALLFGLVSACSFLPMILLSPVGGMIADRVNKRNIMVILDFSTAGLTLAFTLLLRPDFAPDKASMITLVMALSVVEAVEEITGTAAGIKWPNDIVMNRKKICGMLTEMTMTPEMDEIQYVVVGAGINVKNAAPEDFQEEVRPTATSLRIETGQQYNRAGLLNKVLLRFEENYAVFLETLDLSGLRERYQKHLLNMGAQVRVLDPAGEYTGTAEGIDMQGELIVVKDNGERTPVYAGEVSVRGLYGYV